MSEILEKVPKECVFCIMSYLTQKPELLHEIKGFMKKSELINIWKQRIAEDLKFHGGLKNRSEIEISRSDSVVKCERSGGDLENGMYNNICFHISQKKWRENNKKWENAQIETINNLIDNKCVSIEYTIAKSLKLFTYNDIKQLLVELDKDVISKWIGFPSLVRRLPENIYEIPFSWMYDENGKLKQSYYESIRADAEEYVREDEIIDNWYDAHEHNYYYENEVDEDNDRWWDSRHIDFHPRWY